MRILKMNSKQIKKALSLLFVILIGTNLLACESLENTKENTETCRVYDCDYKSLNLNTKITTTLDGEEISITGNIFTWLIDPLTVKDSKGNVLGYAGDAYGIIEQDDHGIYVGNMFEINMCGNFELFGNSYQLKDEEGNVIANAKFNEFSTSGSIADIEGNLVATYSSSLIANDYTVTIYDNDICSDMSILMIVASYVSDYKADSSN